MNIFILSEDPVEAAQMQCDQHVVKMTLETAQLLCSPFPVGIAPYKRTHFQHPCSIWTREAKDNFQWLCDHGKALAQEYTYRYGKVHRSEQVIDWCMAHRDMLQFSQLRRTPFAVVVEHADTDSDAVTNYRRFYLTNKRRFARWQRGRACPVWWV